VPLPRGWGICPPWIPASAGMTRFVEQGVQRDGVPLPGELGVSPRFLSIIPQDWGVRGG